MQAEHVKADKQVLRDKELLNARILELQAQLEAAHESGAADAQLTFEQTLALAAQSEAMEQLALSARRERDRACLHAEMTAALKEEVDIATADLGKLRDDFARRMSQSGHEAVRKRLTKSYMDYWTLSEDARDPLGLIAAKKTCDNAECPEEFARLRANCQPCRSNRGTENWQNKAKDRESPASPQQLTRERQVVANWINSLELSNQRVHVMQSANATLQGKISAAAASYQAGVGHTVSIRQSYTERKEVVDTYHLLLAEHQKRWLARSKNAAGEDTACVVGWVDDYTSFNTHQSFNEGKKRSVQFYATRWVRCRTDAITEAFTLMLIQTDAITEAVHTTCC